MIEVAILLWSSFSDRISLWVTDLDDCWRFSEKGVNHNSTIDIKSLRRMMMMIIHGKVFSAGTNPI